MKNKIITFLIAIVCGFSIHVEAQKINGFTLNGQFNGLPNGTKLYLRTQEQDTIAKAISKGDRFTFRGNLPLDGRFHFIRVDSLVSKVGSKAIFLENKAISVTGVLGSRDVIVNGSQAQLDYNQLIEEMSRINDNEKQIQLRDTWINNHPESLVAPWFISALDLEERQKAYHALTKKVKESYYGIELKKNLEIAKLAELVKPGKVLPDFKIKSPDEKSFSVLEYAKKGKLTLIDFWASWCEPCRAETHNMKKVYEAFHSNGFNIIGVSSDAKEADWKKALDEENTPWFHGRDNLDKATKYIFSIGAIPAFALVDGEGKLIAFECGMSNIPSFGPSIRGEGLYKTIETLLKEKSK